MWPFQLYSCCWAVFLPLLGGLVFGTIVVSWYLAGIMVLSQYQCPTTVIGGSIVAACILHVVGFTTPLLFIVVVPTQWWGGSPHCVVSNPSVDLGSLSSILSLCCQTHLPVVEPISLLLNPSPHHQAHCAVVRSISLSSTSSRCC